MHTFAAFTYVQGMGVIVCNCLICQLIFKKVWLPQQLTHGFAACHLSRDLQQSLSPSAWSLWGEQTPVQYCL